MGMRTPWSLLGTSRLHSQTGVMLSMPPEWPRPCVVTLVPMSGFIGATSRWRAV